MLNVFPYIMGQPKTQCFFLFKKMKDSYDCFKSKEGRASSSYSINAGKITRTGRNKQKRLTKQIYTGCIKTTLVVLYMEDSKRERSG